MVNFSGKIALLTGASRGIGPYIARTLANQGVLIVGIARSEEGLAQTHQTISSDNKFLSIPFDLMETHRLNELVQMVKKRVGQVDILINNAGIEKYQFYHKNEYGDLEQMIRTNLIAPLELTRILLPDMLERGGHIVTIASLAGKKGIAYNSIYSATKAGLIMWTDGLRQELAETNVHISVICPGYISETGMFHNGGVDPPSLLGTSTPEAVAAAVIKVLTEKRAELIVNRGPMKPLLAIGQLSPTFGDKVVKWFGVPELSRKRIQE